MKERGSVFVAFALVFLFVLSVGVVSAFWSFTTTGKVTDDYSTSAQIIISDARVYDGLIDYTSVGADNIKTPIKAVTVGGWFNTEALRIGNNEITGSWVSKRNSYILSAETDGSVKFWVFLDDTWYYVSSPTNSVSLNVWEHWVGIWDGSTISLYKNGELVASTPASGTLGTTGDLCIGHDCGLSAPYDNRYFKGSLKDLRVYIDALSASAVKKLYVEKKDAPSDETASCTDSDNGLNVDKYGWTNFTSNSFRFIHDDECALVSNYNSSGEPVGWQSATSCSGNDCYVEEAFCRTDDNGNFNDADADELIPCPNGCSMGSCATSGGSGNEDKTLNEIEFERLKKLADSLRETTTITNDGSYVLQLKTTIRSGEVTVPLLYTNSSGSFIGIGKGPSNRLVTSSETNRVLYNYTGGDRYMVVTLNDSRNPVSYLIRFNAYTAEDSANKTTIEYYNNGAWESKGDKKSGDTVIFDNFVSLKIDEVYINSGSKWVYVNAQDNRIKFNMLATKEGLAIYLPTVSESLRPYLYGSTVEAGATGHSILPFPDKFYLDVRGQDASGNFEAGKQAIIVLSHQRGGSSGYVDVNEILTRQPFYSDPTNSNNIISSTGGDVPIVVLREGPSSAPRTAVIYYSGRSSGGTSSGGGSGSGGGGSGNSCSTIGCSLPSSDGSNKCIAFGTRTGGNYCALSGTMNAQGASEATCENNYECGSNVCASGKCVDAGLFQKIIDFFKNLFGG